MAIETISAEIINGEVNASRKGDIEKSNVTNKFVCIPGVSPLNMPPIIPTNTAIIISIIILLFLQL